jgi:hypothetical protein
MIVSELPYLRQQGNVVAAVSNGTTARLFDPLSGGGYQARHFSQELLSYANNEFTLTDTAGNKLRYYDFSASLPQRQRGKLKSLTDPAGNVTSVTGWDSAGRPLEVQRSWTAGSVTTTESFLYAYVASGTNEGKLQSVTQRHQTGGGPWSVVRVAEYAYYAGVAPFGNAGDLKTATVKDAAGNVLDTNYYRYYTQGQAGGYKGGMRFAFSPASFARLAAAVADPFTATDAQVAPYADLYFEYDSSKRVSKEIVQGTGCSSCTGGLGTYTFSYSTSTFADGYNSWERKTVETLPDGNQNIVFTNHVGQVVLKSFKETATGREWLTAYRYDAKGRLVLTAYPSAVSGYDETKADLLNSVSGNYQHLRDTEGVVEALAYHASTTAGETTAGAAAGYLSGTGLQRGELGTLVPQEAFQYYAHAAGGTTVYPVATETAYAGAGGTGARTTTYAYTWFSGTTKPQSVTVTHPAVSAAQNGPGSADVETTYLDAGAARPG